MALVQRIQKTTDATHWPGNIPMQYIYTAGRAGEKFFTALKEGKFVGARCDCCDVTYVPPRTFCERCFGRIEDAIMDLPNQGVVHTFTVSYEDYQGNAKEDPSLLAVIQFDDSWGGLCHWLGEVDPEDCLLGMPVEAVFKPEGERTGSILDIEYFRPVAE